MSYSQKIKNLLHRMKKSNNISNNFKSTNISRNCLNYKNNKPLINEENYLNNTKPLPYKKNQNKYKTSHGNKINDDKIEYIQLYDKKNYINNNKYKYNNNFIVETSYEKSKPKISYKIKNTKNYFRSSISNININDNNNNNYSNYNNIEEKNLLYSKINHLSSENKNKYNVYFSYNKEKNIKNLNNSEDKIHNVFKSDNFNSKYLSSMNSNKKQITSYILKNNNNEFKFYINNTSPINFSSYYNKKNFKINTNITNENYITNINNSYKNISSRIIKKQPIKTLSELFNEEKNTMVNTNISNNNPKKYKNLKQKLLLIDKGYNFIYDNKNKKSKFKRNYNSSSNIRERDYHYGGKIILSLNENSLKKKRKKIKNLNYFITIIQSFWRGYMLRKLIKITRELFLLFFPFSNKIKKLFNKYKKYYFSLFKNNIKQFFTRKKNIIKGHLNNISRIKKNSILYNKNNNNHKSQKFIKKNVNITPLLTKENNLKKNKNNYNPINASKNDIKQLKINNIFYHTKKTSFNKNENKSKIMKNSNKLKTNDSNLKIENYNHITNRRLIKRTFYKKFNNVSPEYRNIELNINNSLKNTLYKQKNNNLNNYSSSISIFFQTQFPESRINSLKNLVYINKNKKPKNSIKLDMFEKIKNKLFNNFYLTICKCIKKTIYRFYWNKLLLKLKQIKIIASYNEKKINILKSIIINITNKIKKKYFRKYRENILIEKIKTKLFYLTDYSQTNCSLFNSKYIKLKNKEKSKTQKLLYIFRKYNLLKIEKNYFSIWKMNIFNIDFPLYSSRYKYSKQKMQNYIKKMINYNIDDMKKENQQIIYKRNKNYIPKDERIPIKKNMTQSNLYIKNYISPKNEKSQNYKKKISNKSIKLNSIIHQSKQNQSCNNVNENKLFSSNKIKEIFDEINNKNLQYIFFNLWKKKIKKKIIKKNKSSFNRNIFLKYVLLYLKYFMNANKQIINNKIKIGFYLFIWYKKAFINNKRKKLFFLNYQNNL